MSLNKIETRYLLDLILDRMQEIKREVTGLRLQVTALRAGQDELLQRLADGRLQPVRSQTAGTRR